MAVLATRRRDGQVLLSTVWHEWRDGGFTEICTEDDVKVQHLHERARASIVVFGSEPRIEASRSVLRQC